jgi:type IV secretory pathway TrbF-like protein
MGAVATRKVSVTLDADVLERVRDVARWRGMSLSAWLSEAAERTAKVDEGRRAVEEWEEENGPFSEETNAAVQRVMHIIDISRQV